jgi:DNA-binding transcriptional ArsR family regulator
MSQEAMEAILSSKARLRVVGLVSLRPRSLRELADLTGISVQGVLKHLTRLKSLGMVDELKLKTRSLPVRKLYTIKDIRVGDFSQGDMTVVKLSRPPERAAEAADPAGELDALAADAIVERRRIREQARRLGRAIDELVATEARIAGLVRGLTLEEEDKLLLHTLFTEESMEEAESALRADYGLREPRRALEKAVSRAKKLGKK